MTLAVQTENLALLSSFKSHQLGAKSHQLSTKSHQLSKNSHQLSKNSNQLEKIYRQTFSAQINYFKQGMSGRAHLEEFIRGVYKKYYNADIDQFYPNLLAIESNTDNSFNSSLNQKKNIKAVAGVRSAENDHLFSEYYLSDSLENEIASRFSYKMNEPVSRKTIVEVGNLAPANVGQMRWLITTITGFLYSAGFKYLLFTGVPGISNSFKRMNIPLEILAEAKQECLPEEIQHKWGPEYYQNNPMVFLGDIELGYEVMKENIYKSNQKLIPLFEQACHVGSQSLQSTDNTDNFQGNLLEFTG